MRRTSVFWAVFLLGIGVWALSLRGDELPSIDYYVSPAGDDAAAGSAESPLATIAGARDRIRADKDAGKSARWTVRLAPGIYPIAEPIVFEPRDGGAEGAPIRYVGERSPDGRFPFPVISGGIEITGWRDAGGGVWEADLPLDDGGEPLYFEQLFVGERRAQRAREPNDGFLAVVGGVDENPMDREKKIFPKNTNQTLELKEGALDFMKGTPPEELRFAQVSVHHHWNVTTRILLGFDPEKSELFLKGTPQQTHNGWGSDSLAEIFNVRSAFDAPGEWFYDGTNRKVLYRPLPGETLESARFVVPRPGLVRAIRFEGKSTKSDGADPPRIERVENLEFENLAISYFDTVRRPRQLENAELDPAVTGPLDRPGPSQFDPSQAANFLDGTIGGTLLGRVAFRGCRVSHIGEYAIRLSDADQCRVERCDLFDLGGGGITIVGSGGTDEDSPGMSACNVIRNNRIRQGGRFHPTAVGVMLGNNTHDNEVAHNEIEDFYYTGVSVGWHWGYGGVALRNRVEFNKIHNLGQGVLADMGGVYTLGLLHGTRVCNNVIYDVKSNAYGGWGLYTDEGSEGVLMENNLVYRTTDGSFHQHFGRGNLIRNNIFVDSTPYQVVASRVEPHRSFTFENNIVVWSEGRAFGHRFEKVSKLVRGNTWFCTTGPAMFGDAGDKTYDQMRAEGFDEGGVCADPLFVDPQAGDYRLRPESPALKAGFVPFDYSKAGIEE